MLDYKKQPNKGDSKAVTAHLLIIDDKVMDKQLTLADNSCVTHDAPKPLTNP